MLLIIKTTKCIVKYATNLVASLPINALGIVILSHILSLMSRPESGAAIVLTIVVMSVFTESPSPSGSSVYPITEGVKHN